MPARHLPCRRVLMTGDCIGGVWTYCLELAQALTARGIKVLLATMGQPLTADQARQAGSIRGLRVDAADYRLEWMRDPWADIEASGRWLLQLKREFQPDLIHLNTYAHGALDWRVPVLMVGHSCVLSWWRAVHGSEAPAEWDPYRQAVQRGLLAADLVVAPTAAMLAELKRYYAPLPPSRVIPNGLTPSDPWDASPEPSVGARMAQQSHPTDRASTAAGRGHDCRARREKEPIILSVGRLWDEAKNLALLQGIAPNLAWPICIAGDNRHPDGGLAPTTGCRFLGRLSRPELAPWFARAAIYALPARYEPFGLSALEAALARCALVLGDIPSLRELWRDAAILVPPNDPGAWRNALCTLIDNDNLRTQWGDRAYLRALEFSTPRMADAYLDAYRCLASNRSSAKEPACAS